MKSSLNSEEEDLTRQPDGQLRFQCVCAFDELKEGCGKRFIIDDVEVALFKVKGKIYALSNICPHQHTTLIYDGFIEEGCVVCPVHGWTFSLETGKTPSENSGLDRYDVRIIDNQVYVKVYKKNLPAGQAGWNW